MLTLGMTAALGVLPPGMNILDAKPYYSASQALGLLDALGEQGRKAYVMHQYVDLLYLVAYTSLFRALLHRFGWRTWVRNAVLLPGALDLVETAGIVLLLHQYEQAPYQLARALGVVTLCKWVSVAPVLGVAAWDIYSARHRH